MKDYEITIKVRNNCLLSAIRKAGYESPAAFARHCGIGNVTLYAFIALKRLPLRVNDQGVDQWAVAVQKMADALATTPESLFPPQHIRTCLEKNSATLEMDAGEAAFLIDNHRTSAPDFLLEQKELASHLDSALQTLSPRDACVIRDLFGFDGPALQYKDCAKKYNVSSARIHSIKLRALKRLARPTVKGTLRPFLISHDDSPQDSSMEAL
jgi:DNA-directed RNA polymerase specialized sigma24 family protein